MAYGDFKDLTIISTPGKILRDKSFNIAKVQNMMDVKEVFLQWFIEFLIKNPLFLQINLLLVVVLKTKICQKRIS